MKKILVFLYSFLVGAQSFAAAPLNIDEKILRSFRDRFPHAEQVVWKELPEGIVVNFLDEGVRSHITYGKDGEFVGATRYYEEKNLPYYLFMNIQKKYPGEKIYSVTEVSTIAEIEYYIKLEDTKVWTTLKIDHDGNLSVVEKYRKAS